MYLPLFMALASILCSKASFIVILFIAIVEFKFPRIMFLIILPFNCHIQFLNNIIGIVHPRNVRVWKYWILPFPYKSRLFYIELGAQHFMLIYLGWLLIAA